MRSDKAWYLLLYDVCGINKCMVFHKMNLTLFQNPRVHCHLFILELGTA